MYRINYTGRPVLITPDEVVFHAATDTSVDPRQILQNIIVAEERWIAPALGDDFYYDLVAQKNVEVTASNQASLLASLNASLTAAALPTAQLSDIPIGTYINAIELVADTDLVTFWKMFLWKITAEAVDLATIVPSWLRHTAQGQQKNNPEVIGGNGQNSASGDRKDVQYKIDKAIQDRLDPLLERMHLWLCKRKSLYPLYTKACECDNPNGVAFKRKTDWVFLSDKEEGCTTCDNDSGNDIDNYIELE